MLYGYYLEQSKLWASHANGTSVRKGFTTVAAAQSALQGAVSGAIPKEIAEIQESDDLFVGDYGIFSYGDMNAKEIDIALTQTQLSSRFWQLHGRLEGYYTPMKKAGASPEQLDALNQLLDAIEEFCNYYQENSKLTRHETVGLEELSLEEQADLKYADTIQQEISSTSPEF